ncbi:MAG TPA: AtpZ/AtpI family protein [Deltaproteobacteria bacterium]|nr:AtpZ/AtpI family protein [Deltaproteobacteria bacterium]HOM30316.1 AtpZ/AtpI family protein [Deltaproteobacteria bacterium]HPP81911.1 AtpZ/AtpI family protein [Deltaproteobacteria bacterium]
MKARTKREAMTRDVRNRVCRISGYSLVLVVMTFIGLYGGMWLDKTLGMAPNFTLVGLVAGVCLGFKGFVEEVIIERKAKRA